MEGQRDHEKHELNSVVIEQEMGTEALVSDIPELPLPEYVVGSSGSTYPIRWLIELPAEGMSLTAQMIR